MLIAGSTWIRKAAQQDDSVDEPDKVDLLRRLTDIYESCFRGVPGKREMWARCAGRVIGVAANPLVELER